MAPALNDGEIQRLIEGFAAYVAEQREHFLGRALPLTSPQQEGLEGYFSAELLRRVRIVELHGDRIPMPPRELREIIAGYLEAPDISHMHSFTYGDVMVFQDPLNSRRLFHALVHAAQFALLGLQPYLDLYIKAFLKTGKYLTVPLEVQAFKLDAAFAASPALRFNVEEEITACLQKGLYLTE